MKNMVDFRLFGKTQSGEVNHELMKLQLQFAESERAYPPRLAILIHCNAKMACHNLSTTLAVLGTEPQIEPHLFFALPNPSPGKAYTWELSWSQSICYQALPMTIIWLDVIVSMCVCMCVCVCVCVCVCCPDSLSCAATTFDSDVNDSSQVLESKAGW